MAVSKSTIFFLIVFLAYIQVNATKFDCENLDPAACKTKFGEQYERDFKILHLNGVYELFNKYINVSKKIKNELATDDVYTKVIDDICNNLENDIKMLKDNENDNKKVAHLIEQAMHHMEWELQESSTTENFKKLVNKYFNREELSKSMRDVVVEMAQLWSEMYAGLRSEDLKAYPEYEKLNTAMKKLQFPEIDEEKRKDYFIALNCLENDFNLQYIKLVDNLI